MRILSGLGSRVDLIAFADDGQAILATSLETDDTAFWRLPEGGLATCFSMAGVAFTPDGKFIIGEDDNVVGRMPLSPSPDEFVPGSREIRWLHNENCIKLSPDQRRLVASKGDELLWWSWPSFKSLKTWTMELCGEWCVADVSFSPDGASVAVFQHEGVTLHNTKTGRIKWTAQMKANTNFGCLAWSPDGRLMAAGGGKLLRVFDASDGSLIAERKQASKHFLDAEFTRDGCFLATVSN